VKASERYEELLHMLAPAGAGVHVVSTGLEETRQLQQEIYGVSDASEVKQRWREDIMRIASARVIVLGVPSDAGAGFVRGANQGPGAIRRFALTEANHPYKDEAVIDAGDVRVVPHLLSEEMVSDEQRRACQESLYGGASELPVSPLGICRRALDHLRHLAPQAVPVVLGGDHSIGWPAFASAFHIEEKVVGHRIGLLHFDAHTDLLPERLGVRYCFATWAYHANELLQRDGRLVQVGIRASGQPRAHWEKTYNVRQYWPAETDLRPATEVSSEIIERFRSLDCTALYISNDIDGTDGAFASATGTPEAGGPPPQYVREIVQRVSAAFPTVGGDLVEVAPPLAGSVPGEPETTLQTASDYFADLISAGTNSQSEAQ